MYVYVSSMIWKKIVKYEMSYCMYVACILYVCIMTRMIQVGRARPGARSSAAAPGSGCTVIAAVTWTRTYVTLIAVQVEHAT